MPINASPPLSAIGGYEIVQQLAQTDRSVLYKGRHQATGEVAAVKVAGPETLRDPVLLKRFEQEFAVSRSLDHPHLTRVLHFGHERDVPYIVMEFVEGPSLADRIKREGRLPETEAVRIIIQVAEALYCAHKHRIIHRDIKPDSILLGRDGRAKLTDLSLAKDIDSDRRLTQTRTGLGTPQFIAPEQFNDAKNAGPRSDIYSLAATLYVAITGQLPFQARGPMSICMKKLNNEFVPPGQLVPGLNPWVESAVCRALQANPRDRPASSREFIEELNGRDLGPPAPIGAGSRDHAPTGGAKQRSSAAHRRPQQRATVRYPSSKQCPCSPLSAEQDVSWTATVRDVSAGGIGLVLSRRFEPGTVLMADFADPGLRPGRRLFVRVVRVQALADGRWLLGCAFARNLGDEEVQDLL